MELNEGLLERVPDGEKLGYVLGRLVFGDRSKAMRDSRDLSLSTSLLKAEAQIALEEGGEALSVIEGCEFSEQANYYNFEEWISAYFKYLISSGLEQEALSIVGEYLKVARDDDSFNWVCRVYMTFLGKGDVENATVIRGILVAYNSGFEDRLDNLDGRVHQRERQGGDEVLSSIETVLGRVAALFKLERDDEAEELAGFVRERLLVVVGEDEAKGFNARIDDIFARKGADGMEELRKKAMEAEAAYNVILTGDYKGVEQKLMNLRHQIPLNYYVLMGLTRIAFLKKNPKRVHNMLAKLLAHHSDDVDACSLGASVFVWLAERKCQKKRTGHQRGRALPIDVVSLCSRADFYLRKGGRASAASGKMVGVDSIEAREKLDALGYRSPRYIANKRGLKSPPSRKVDVSQDSVWIEIKSLLTSGQYDVADATLRRFLKDQPREGALDANKCLFEIALIKKDWAEAERLLKVVSESVSRDMMDFYTAKLAFAKSSERVAPNGYKSNRFWDQMGSMDPVDSTACRVTGNRRRE